MLVIFHNHWLILIMSGDVVGLTVTVTALRGLSVKPLPDTDTWNVVVVVRLGEGVKFAPVWSSVPPVAAAYHLKTGLVTELAVAVRVTASPLHMSVLLLVTVIRSAEPPTVIVTLLVSTVPQVFVAWRRKCVVVVSAGGLYVAFVLVPVAFVHVVPFVDRCQL